MWFQALWFQAQDNFKVFWVDKWNSMVITHTCTCPLSLVPICSKCSKINGDKWTSDQGCIGLLLLWRALSGGSVCGCFFVKRIRWYVGMHGPKRPPWKRHRGARCICWGCEVFGGAGGGGGGGGGGGEVRLASRSVFFVACLLVVYIPLQRFTKECYRFILYVEFHIVGGVLLCTGVTTCDAQIFEECTK